MKIKQVTVVKIYHIRWYRGDFDSEIEWEAFQPNPDEWTNEVFDPDEVLTKIEVVEGEYPTAGPPPTEDDVC